MKDDMGKDAFETHAEIKRRLSMLEDHLWKVTGGLDKTPDNRYDATVQAIASWLSCLADEDMLHDPDEGRMEALGGLLFNLKAIMTRSYQRDLPPELKAKRRYEVSVVALQPTTTMVTVEATNPGEAMSLAMELVSGDIAAHDWEEQGIEPSDVETAEVRGEFGKGDCCCNAAGHDGPCCPGLFYNTEDREVERCDDCAIFKTDAEARVRYACLIEASFEEVFPSSPDCRAANRDGQWYIEVMSPIGAYHRTWEANEVPVGSLKFTFEEI